MFDPTLVKAITLDLDDTLWPVWPAIERAEKALENWLAQRAPMAAALFAHPKARLDLREQVAHARPDLKHNLSAVRREMIRLALSRAKEDPLLAEPAFEVFFEERNRVTLFEDAIAGLEFLASRFPLVALSNGNADIHRIGLGHLFQASISAQQFGVGKPDPKIFQAAAASVGFGAADVLHVGDDCTLDVLGALNCGMQTVWGNRSDHSWLHAAKPHVTVATLTELCDHFRPDGSGTRRSGSLQT